MKKSILLVTALLLMISSSHVFAIDDSIAVKANSISFRLFEVHKELNRICGKLNKTFAKSETIDERFHQMATLSKLSELVEIYYYQHLLLISDIELSSAYKKEFFENNRKGLAHTKEAVKFDLQLISQMRKGIKDQKASELTETAIEIVTRSLPDIEKGIALFATTGDS